MCVCVLLLLFLQYGETTFNRGKLMNVGYKEARKHYDYSCFVFSDIDIVPMDDRNLYRCYSQPRHLSVAVDKFGFRYGNQLDIHCTFIYKLFVTKQGY